MKKKKGYKIWKTRTSIGKYLKWYFEKRTCKNKKILSIEEISIFKNYIIINSFNTIRGIVVLKSPLTVKYSFEDGMFILKCNDLHIIEMGETLNEAIDNFLEFLIVDSKNYLKMNDELLNEEGLKLKDTYKKYFE